MVSITSAILYGAGICRYLRRNKLPNELAIPAEEVQLLVQRMQRKAPGTTSQMRGKVLQMAASTTNVWNVQQSPNGEPVEGLS